MTWLASDRSRLAGFRRGDRDVLAAVYEHYGSELARSLVQGTTVDGVRIAGLRSALELDDVLQETFVRAFSAEARKSYDGVRPFGAWLSVIARNVLIDHSRRAQRQHVSAEPIEEGALGGQPTPEAAAMDRELVQVYASFLETLDEQDRLLLRLRFEADAPRRVVSEQTGLSAMQVRLRESRLHKALRVLLRRFSFEASGTRRAP